MKNAKYWFVGILFCVLASVFALVVPLYGHDAATETNYFIPVGIGLFFFGLSLIILFGSQDENKALMNEIQKINRRLDSTIVLPQNIIRVPDHEGNNRRDVALALWGVIIGVWAGVLGGILTGSMFDILDHEPATMILWGIIAFFLSSIITLVALTWYVKQIITKLMSPTE
ncbi:MAG: hypothetical protein WCE46_00115 [Methanoregula sp.]|uniref:hypothetical protein n=1 Tax=Methanoregula sp. TaxID=2052170 RepID=UPI003C70628B